MRREKREAAARAAFVVIAGASLISVLAYARADDHPSARLIYERDASARQCPDEPELRDLVSARLGYVPFRDDAALVVTTRIEATPRGLRATVEARNAAGEVTGRREITSRTRDCQELARGVALAVSVAIDPFVLTGGAPPPAPPEDAGVPEPSDAGAVSEPEPTIDPMDAGQRAVSEVVTEDASVAEAVTDDTAPVRDISLRDPRFALGAVLGIASGTVPDPRPYLAIDGAFDHAYFLARLVLRADLPASDARNIGGAVRAWRLATRIDACGGVAFVYACAGVGMRVHFARGTDVFETRSDSATSFSLTTQVLGRVFVHDALALRLGVGLEAPFRRVSLELDEAAVYRERKVSPFLEIGVVRWIP